MADPDPLDPNIRSRYGLSDYQKQVDAFKNSGTEMVTFMGDELKEVTLPKKEYEKKYKGRAVRKRPKILGNKIVSGEAPQVEYVAAPETEELPDPTTYGRTASPSAAVSLLKKLPRPTVSTDPASSVGASSRAAAEDRGERGRLGPVGPQGGAKAFLDLVGGKSPEVESTFENPLTKKASPKGVPEMIGRPEGQRPPELPEIEIDLGAEDDFEIGAEPNSRGGFDEVVDEGFNNKTDYDAFFKKQEYRPTLGTTAQGGVGASASLYAPHRKLLMAKRLRKDGFGRAAEAVALDYARSPEGMAPSISNQAMRQQLAADSAKAKEMKQSNQSLAKTLMDKTRERLLKGGKTNDSPLKFNLSV
jgi:hypothetical protein